MAKGACRLPATLRKDPRPRRERNAPHPGYLRLSLVSCPILLYPATSDAEKIRFNQINKKTAAGQR
jgi:hypothetical protein